MYFATYTLHILSSYLTEICCIVFYSQNRAEYERRVREQALKFRDQSIA